MSQAPFPPEARLRHAAEFRAVFAHGRKVVYPAFVLIAAPGNGAPARLGLALAKRRIARAVDRNRVKRVVRESFRRCRAELGSTDVVVLARSRTAELDNAALFIQLARAWPDVARAVQAAAATAPERAGQP